MINPQIAELSSRGANNAFCVGLVLTRRDGAVIGLTSLDESFSYIHNVRRYNSDGVPVEQDVQVDYIASTGFTPSNYDSDANMTAGNADITGLFVSAGLDLNDVKNGLYDRCGVDVYIFEHTPEPQLRKHLARGWWGRAALQDGRYYAQFQSLASLFTNRVTRRYSFNCDATVGDDRCHVVMDNHVVGGVEVVATSNDPKQLIIAADALDFLKGIEPTTAPTFDVLDSAVADTYALRYGLIEFTTGSNNRLMYNSRSHTLSEDGTQMVIDLYEELIRPVSVGDQFNFVRGCRRTVIACGKIFGNTINFRGFPYIPPKDYIVGTYVAGSVNSSDTQG